MGGVMPKGTVRAFSMPTAETESVIASWRGGLTQHVDSALEPVSAACGARSRKGQWLGSNRVGSDRIESKKKRNVINGLPAALPARRRRSPPAIH